MICPLFWYVSLAVTGYHCMLMLITRISRYGNDIRTGNRYRVIYLRVAFPCDFSRNACRRFGSQPQSPPRWDEQSLPSCGLNGHCTNTWLYIVYAISHKRYGMVCTNIRGFVIRVRVSLASISAFWNGRSRSHTDAHRRRQNVIIKIKGSNANVKRQTENRKNMLLELWRCDRWVPPRWRKKKKKRNPHSDHIWMFTCSRLCVSFCLPVGP